MEDKCRDVSRFRVYLTHFLPVLQKIKRRRSSITKCQQAIRFAADMFLVYTARKRSAWSRALNLRLMRRENTIRKRKMKESSLRRYRSVTVARRMRLTSLNSRFCNNLDSIAGGHDDHDGAIGRRLRTLGKLVPGGGKMEVHTLVQETTDYILNLEMQVQAMEALADFYTTNSAGRVDESIAQKQRGASCAVVQI